MRSSRTTRATSPAPRNSSNSSPRWSWIRYAVPSPSTRCATRCRTSTSRRSRRRRCLATTRRSFGTPSSRLIRTSASSGSSKRTSSSRRRSTAGTSRPANSAISAAVGRGSIARAPVASLAIGRETAVNTDARANGGEPILELRALSKSFGGLRAVRDVTLKIMPGERQAIIGPNGAGKTTLFNLITGIFPATSGQVVLFGQDVTEWPSHRRTALGMARTFQITSLFPKLTVLDNVLLAIQGLRRSKFVMWRFLSSYRDIYDKAYGLLERARFLDRKDTEVRYLSHGEQRQLEIVLGLASDPKILLLDEPAAGLSSGESTEMVEFLAKLDPKLAILLIEHDMDVVFDVADEISVLHFGEILESGAPEKIKKSRRVQEIYLGTE